MGAQLFLVKIRATYRQGGAPQVFLRNLLSTEAGGGFAAAEEEEEGLSSLGLILVAMG